MLLVTPFAGIGAESTVLRRAFDNAVRRKPPVVAADAGPMQFNCGEVWCRGEPELCGRARQSTAGDGYGFIALMGRNIGSALP
jgi:hypothetical protein